MFYSPLMSTTAIIVPARLGSTRFPQKLLHPVNGKPIIIWTADRIRKEAPDIPLYFAVDGESLAKVLDKAGYETVMTSPGLPSGTDRIAAANREIQADRVINVQADEPMVTGNHIRLLDSLLTEGIDMATLGTPLQYNHDYHNPNHVKFVRAQDGRALYFSRSPLPYIRDTQGIFDEEQMQDFDPAVFIHLGLYAYTKDFLEKFSQLSPGILETLEKLEMLRAIEHGYTIATGITEEGLIEIDTPDNVIEFEQALKIHFSPES